MLLYKIESIKSTFLPVLPSVFSGTYTSKILTNFWQISLTWEDSNTKTEYETFLHQLLNSENFGQPLKLVILVKNKMWIWLDLKWFKVI